MEEPVRNIEGVKGMSPPRYAYRGPQEKQYEEHLSSEW